MKNKTFKIAESGVNYNGSMENTKKLIDRAEVVAYIRLKLKKH